MRTKFTFPSILTGLLLCGPLGAGAQTYTPPTTTISTTTTAAANVGQTITISSVAYRVDAKKVLTTGVEYYTVKATTSKAPTKYFLRSNNQYNATVFTQTQYESFVKTGRLSSFGVLKTHTVDGRNYTYVTKGTTNLLFSTSGGDLKALEFIGNVADVLAADNPQEPFGMHPDKKACLWDCVYFDRTCKDGLAECNRKMEECRKLCNDAWPLQKDTSLHLVKASATIKSL